MFSYFFDCPVCKTRLGKRNKSEPIQVFHCKECKAQVTVSNKNKICMRLDKELEKKQCNCGLCGK